MTKYYIYKVTNAINNKIYIGKTKYPKKRWESHLSTAKNPTTNKNGDTYFYRAIRKHGEQNFKFEIIDEFDTEDLCMQAEISYIAKFNSMNRDIGYNRTNGGDGASGYKFSEEQKKQLNQEKKITYIGEGNPFFGKTHTEETKNKIRAAHAGKYDGDKNPFFNKTHSEEALQKMRDNHYNKRKYLNDDEINNIRQLYASNNYTYKQLSEIYNVSTSLIRNIIKFLKAYKKPI